MKTHIDNTVQSPKKYTDLFFFLISFAISISAFLYFYFHGLQHLANYDAVARLNASRKVIDSITPGFGQLGGIWLPFPQVLMIPFIWNDFLWHSGLAGYFISGLSFIFGALYLQKTAFLMTKNRKISFLIWFLFVSNINILLLQTMAMSEMLFMCCLVISCYYLTSWIKTHDLLQFLISAVFIMILTLTRYEGYFVLLGAFIVIIFECLRSFRKEKNKTEGMLLLFLTVAGFGIILWCIYSALFYKDPLFWLHAYSGTSSSIIQGEQLPKDYVYGKLNPSFIESGRLYLSVMFTTNGIITVFLGILGIALYIWSIFKQIVSKEKVQLYMPVAIISFALFFFLIIGYYIGFIPHIEFPPVHLQGLNIREWSVYADSNIRYGMVLLPLLLLFIGFTAAKNSYLFFVTTICVALQLTLNLVRPQLLQYPFVVSWKYPVISYASWFSSNYDGGLVLVSSSRHEDFMFQSALPYKTFIYEGTRQYWRESLKNPAKYASWIVYNDRISGDAIVTSMTKEGYEIMLKKYKLVHQDKGLKIYKLVKK